MSPRYILALCMSLALWRSQSYARRQPDSNYVLNFPGTMTLRTYLGEKISTFRIVDDKRSEDLQFRPNNSLSLGFGVTIRGIGLNFSTRLPFHDYKEDQYGRTRRLDFQLHRYRGKIGFDIYLQRYRGFHLNDKNKVMQVYGPTEYPFYPNLQSITVGASVMYIPNGERYSLRAMTNQQEWQIRSAGSLMVGGSVFSHFVSNSDSAVIPSNLRYQDFLDSSDVKHIHTYGITGNVGYGYNFVFHRNWFFSISGDVGAGVAYTDTKDVLDVTRDKFGFLLNTNARAGAGYNSRKWFAGFYAIYRTDVSPMPFDDAQIRLSEGLFRFVVARRIFIGKQSWFSN